MKSNRLALAGRTCAFALLALATYPATASAQLGMIGTSTEVIQTFIRGVDGSYDAKNDAYLMVGGAGNIFGVCVGSDGKPKSAPFNIYAIAPGAYGAYPRVRYSPDIDGGRGGFLVAWVVEAGSIGWGPVHSRIISCAGGIGTKLGVEQVIDPALAYLESAPAIAYSATSKRFLVVFKGNLVTAKAVDNNGTGIGAAAFVSTGINQGRDPGVAWNSATDDFGVSFSGETYAAFVKIPAANPAAFVRNTIRNTATNAIFITDIDYNATTNTYVMTWWENAITRVAEIDPAGNVIATGIGSGLFQGYDAVSLAANPLTGTYLLVGVRDPGKNIDIAIATELTSHGVPMQAEMQVSTTVPPARYARVTSSTTSKTWNVNWSARNFAALGNQIVSSGGGTVSPVSSPRMSVDRPGNGATVLGTQIEVAGWALDMGSPSGTGIDGVHVWAQPVGGGAPIFVGVATLGIARSDVGAVFGAPKFTNSGFSVVGSIPTPGAYDVTAYAHSAVANAFNAAQTVRITVRGSRPLMWIDTPANNSARTGAFTVSGWALDLGSTVTSGVDAVHIWAFPVTAGGAPQFVAAATLGVSRPDVGAAFGGAQFNNAGFNATANLLPGDYDLVVFARSTLAESFNNVQTVRVHVQ